MEYRHVDIGDLTAVPGQTSGSCYGKQRKRNDNSEHNTHTHTHTFGSRARDTVLMALLTDLIEPPLGLVGGESSTCPPSG